MKLKDQRSAPPGGLYFITSDKRVIRGETMRKLTQNAESYLSGNDLEIPPYLAQVIEDQICNRLPKNMCWQQSGDVMAGIIAKTASLVDSALGTNLEAAAKGCSGCARRRRAMNRITS